MSKELNEKLNSKTQKENCYFCEKEQCEYCLEYFPKKELDELILTREKVCKKCLKELEEREFTEDPEPFSC